MIYGKAKGDYFSIFCEKCDSMATVEYGGWDPTVPFFNVTCPKCGDLGRFKVPMEWRGLPPTPHKP